MEDINKLQEEIMKADNKNVEKMWKSFEECSFEAFLEKMTKDELVKIAKRYSVKGITTLKKADAVARVKDVILSNSNTALNKMEEGTFSYLLELIEENGYKKYQCNEMIYINFLRNRGLAFSGTNNDEAFVVIPEEIKSIISQSITREMKEKIRQNDEIIKAISGMAYYYGVISINQVTSNLKNIFGVLFEDKYINELLVIGEELGYDYVIENDNICHIDVEDTDEILKLQNNFTKDYYKFDKKSFVKAGKIDFIEENKQSIKLEKALGELFVIDKSILREEMDSFIVAIKNEAKKEEAIDIFLEAYEIQSDEERKILTYELELLAKSVRKWSLKGYTEDEIEKEANRVINEVKVGRNDPCICGSGKKYKKCCG